MDEHFSPQAIWGRELRYYRERAGLTQNELADTINYSDSLISSIETGHAPATEEFAEAADGALNSDGALVRTLDWRKGAPAYPSWFIDWIPAEEKALLIRTFEMAWSQACCRRRVMPSQCSATRRTSRRASRDSPF